MDEIKTLIDRMTQAEKRYFRIYSRFFSQSDKRYLTLFDVYANQKKHSITTDPYIAQIRQQLKIKILESLRLFNAGKTESSFCHAEIQNAEILMQKGLHQQALKTLRGLNKWVIRTGNEQELLKIRQLEITCHVRTGNINQMEAQLIQLDLELPSITKRISNDALIEKEYLFFTIMNKRTDFIRNEKELTTFESSVNSAIFSIPEDEFSLNTLCKRAYIGGMGAFLKGEFESARNYFEQELEVYHFSNSLCEKFPLEWCRSIANNCLLSLYLKDIDRFRELFPFLKKMSKTDEKTALRVHLLEIYNLLQQENYRELIDEHLQSFRDWIRKSHFTENIYGLLWFTQALIAIGDHLNSSKLLGEFLNRYDQSEKSDLLILARVTRLLVWLDAERMDETESEVRSIIRQLNSDQRMFAFEDLVLSFIIECTKKAQISKKEVMKLNRELRRLMEQPFNHQLFLFPVVNTWIERKMNEMNLTL
jgi:hypothetical protein